MNTIRLICRVDRREINYIRVTLESYDGMAVVRTLDPHAALIEVLISPGCEKEVCALLDSMRHKENLRIEEEG